MYTTNRYSTQVRTKYIFYFSKYGKNKTSGIENVDKRKHVKINKKNEEKIYDTSIEKIINISAFSFLHYILHLQFST